LLSLLALRAGLVALPFALWFAWRAWARRNGRDVGAPPYLWLFAAAAVLVGISLMATAVFHRDNRGQFYVPGEVGADGRVGEGRYYETPRTK
jgi:hypothetical protein